MPERRKKESKNAPRAARRAAPISTYRIQLRPDFTLHDCANLLDYLQALGISDVYLSPIFTPQRGSVHGYDVVDHGAISPALGGEKAFAELVAAVTRRSMGILLDCVPNHMGVGDDTNGLWWDVLENGPSSPYAQFFDIDWNPPKTDLANQVLLPVLGDQYGIVLERGELRLSYGNGAFTVGYYDRTFPIAPRTIVPTLTVALERARKRLPADDAALVEFESIITQLRNLPLRTDTDAERVKERQREKEVARKRLDALVASNDAVMASVHETVSETNGHIGVPESFDALHSLLDDQAYRLCFWRVAADEINYRRFFDVNELAAIRVEAETVFGAAHELITRYSSRGDITGLRIDHIDGLYDPAGYLDSLQHAHASAGGKSDLYVVIEKILCGDEKANPAWRMNGTVGYDFLNLLNGLFVRRENRDAFIEFYKRDIGGGASFDECVHVAKKLIMLVSMSSEVHMLARKLDRISEQHRSTRDFTASNLQFALREVIASFSVYRSYLSETSTSNADRHRIESAVADAKRRNPATSPSVFDFIASVLLRHDPPGLPPDALALRRDFAMRFQQLTGPVMAKGVEDTAFYRWYPLASLNEVGGDPRRFGVAPEEFHRASVERLAAWPHSLLSSSTHDTKRGEDTRARLNALSEIPAAWREAFVRWSAMNAAHRTSIAGADAPDLNEEYLIYQTLVGTWPFAAMAPSEFAAYRNRITSYMEKALREAKRRTSWINPNVPHDDAVRKFISMILSREHAAEFISDLEAFLPPIMNAGMWNSLGQVIVKAASPGVPDFYQGAELWDLTLVDPDNRRPVDFALRAALLAEMEALPETLDEDALHRLTRDPASGAVKLHVTRRALALRNRKRTLFERGDYIPIAASGPRERDVVAFARCDGDDDCVAVVGRFHLNDLPEFGERSAVGRAWSGTRLCLPASLAGSFTDVITGRARGTSTEDGGHYLALESAFELLPIALLERTAASA